MSEDGPEPGPKGASTRRKSIVLGVVALAVVGGIVFREMKLGGLAGFGVANTSIAPTDALPSSSFLTIAVDVRAVRSAPWWPMVKSTFGLDTGKLLGLPSLEATCGYDPTAAVDSIAVAVPEAGDRGDFGVAMGGVIDADALVDCAKKLVQARSSKSPNEQFAVRERAGFHVLDENGTPRFALHPGGPYLVGRGAWLGQMIDAAAGDAPRFPASDADKDLVRAARGSLPAPPELLATAILPADVRDHVRREMESETDEASKASMNGVLGVSTAALAIRLPPASSASPLAELTVELRCESDEACAAVAKLALAKRLQWSKDLRLRFVGLGPALDSFTVQAEGHALHAKMQFDPAVVLGAIKRVLPSDEPRPSIAVPPLPPLATGTPPAPSNDGGRRSLDPGF